MHYSTGIPVVVVLLESDYLWLAASNSTKTDAIALAHLANDVTQ